MRSTRSGIVVTALMIGVLTMIASPAEASWWDSLGKDKTVSLAKIIEDPDAFKATSVDFVIQFHETTGFFNPFFTRCTPERYVNFAAWGEGQALWMPEDFARSHPLFFVVKDTPMSKKVLKAAPFTRFRCKGRVESTFMGRAWISITEIEEEGTSLTSTALGNIIAGDKFAQQDRHNAAIQHYLKAYGDKGLPPAARAAVAGRLGKSYLEVRKPLEAQKYLDEAVKLDPKDKDSKALLNTAGARVAGAPVGPKPEPKMDGEDVGGEKPVEDDADDEPVPAPVVEEPEPKKDPAKDSEDPTKRLTGPR